MVFSYAARLRNMGNSYIVSELNKAGLTGIVPSHGEILLCLLYQGPMRMGELTGRVRRTKSTVTVLVTKLVKAGYVERKPDPADSRSAIVSLTPKGMALRPAFEAISDGLDNLLRDRLSDEELADLSSLLQRAVS